MAITLDEDTTRRLRASITQFFSKELDLDIGELKAGTVLDFCLREIGPSIYNRGVAHAQAYLHDRLADLEGACYEPEFTYWTSSEGGGVQRRPGGARSRR